MLKRFFCCLALACLTAAAVLAQNANSSGTTRTRTTTAAAAPQEEPTPTPRASNRRKGTGKDDPTSKDVLEAFNAITEGIKAANAAAVNGGYWNSPQLVTFNNNGTVTRGWAQVRSNRASSYPEAKNVQLDVRDVRVQMLGREGALVTCLWTQSQEFRGTPESATGRLTVVFRLINNGWKIVHTHTSPDAPDPSRLLPSEQTPPPATAKPEPPARP